ncbi:50S ribosomal protein L18 [Parvularcula flava]|uniref:Large ribosomal subunit protein uL18 n=1 Tax=Aquisalinus luteolus TaxID=1566827 RepID=A0A8J3A141_9PROT|nr:50S ribosomal protein L18 [Aquisalinus luteolus]NHK27339.1 50S ribosomal protein L18 [Aquisalinus luteolus]GGH95135.1 50S ribosomal protein L18 [Aquisalinus luteolus]
MAQDKSILLKRAGRTRAKLARHSKGKLRLSVFRSSKNITAQIIDDKQSKTVASASSLEKDLLAKVGKGSNVEAASEVGKLVAERAKQAGIEEVVFDRGAYIYHGRVKALAEAAREAGLKF